MTTPGTADPKRKFVWTALVLSLLGVVIAAYLLYEHYTRGAMLGCSKNGTFDCEAVNTSVFSEIKGIPMALYGLVGYVLAAILVFRRLRVGPEEGDGSLALAWCFSVLALAMDGFLLWAQVARIHHYCPWCMTTYVISAGLFITTVIALGSPARAFAAIGRDWRELGGAKPLAWGLIVLILATVGLIGAKKPPEGVGTWCLGWRLCTNESTGAPTIGPLTGHSFEDEARERILHAPFLDPGPGGGYARGPANPILTIVEFGDLECPACRRFSWVMDSFLQNHPNEVRQVFRHYPLDQLCNSHVHVRIHEFACATARAAEAAGLQGKFWDFEEDVYKQNDASGNFINKPDLTPAGLEARAKALGLNVDQWSKDTGSDPVISKILDDVEIGAQMGINSTPTIFVNGRMVAGGASEETLEVWLKMAKKGELDPHGPKSAAASN